MSRPRFNLTSTSTEYPCLFVPFPPGSEPGRRTTDESLATTAREPLLGVLVSPFSVFAIALAEHTLPSALFLLALANWTGQTRPD